MYTYVGHSTYILLFLFKWQFLFIYFMLSYFYNCQIYKTYVVNSQYINLISHNICNYVTNIYKTKNSQTYPLTIRIKSSPIRTLRYSFIFPSIFYYSMFNIVCR